MVGQALVEHPDVAGLSFTGSVPTGRRLAAACVVAEPMKKLQLEMGSKHPLIVLDDADLCARASPQQRNIFLVAPVPPAVAQDLGPHR